MIASAKKHQYFNKSEVVALYKNKKINPMGDS